jgi:hypothetical protein
MKTAVTEDRPTIRPAKEWVYDAAKINESRVIWAREMDPASNLELIRRYSNRRFWLVQPDTIPAAVTPYVGDIPGSH